MKTKEWAILKHNSKLDVEFLHAQYVQHAYPRHNHDYYVVSLIERGRQSFTHEGTKYKTSPGGVILINPGAVHTGEAVDERGFELHSLYPTISNMKMAIHELTGRQQALPFFADVRVDHPATAKRILALHRALSQETSSIECESQLIWTLTHLIKHYAAVSYPELKPGNENSAVQKALYYIEECFAEDVNLNELAQYVALSPYYFLRVFCAKVGMPPHAYLESVRIRHAQRLIRAGKPLAEVAIEIGFNSQSHMTRGFKKIIGVTPGQYARD